MNAITMKLTTALTRAIQGSRSVENEVANTVAQAAATGSAGMGAAVHVGSVAAGKTAFIIGGGFTGALVILMTFMQPKTRAELGAALSATAACCLAGGSTIVTYFGLGEWLLQPFGDIALGGVYFAAGVPGWAFMRALFLLLEKIKNTPLDDVVRDAKDKLL